MQYLREILITVVITCSTFAFFQTGLAACSCGPSNSIEEEVRSSKLVFLGQVTKGDYVTTVIKAETIWVGGKFESVTLAPEPTTSCDFEFQVGERYLIFAYIHKGLLRVSKCSLTKKAADAKSIQFYLEAPKHVNWVTISLAAILIAVIAFLFSGLLARRQNNTE